MEDNNTPNGVAIIQSYQHTPAHFKTLDLVGKSKSFSKLTWHEICEFLQYGEYRCNSHHHQRQQDHSVSGGDLKNEVLCYLSDRYCWDIESRAAEFDDAWKHLHNTIQRSRSSSSSSSSNPMYIISRNGKSLDDRTPVRNAEDAATGGVSNSGVPSKQLVDDDGGEEQKDSIPLILRAGSMNKPMIICQFDDDNLHFDGDSGAIGRLFCDDKGVRMDIKGRQYEGLLMAGPTMMILNIAPPTGGRGSSGGGVTAYTDLLTNEFCALEFKKDLDTHLHGVYTSNEGGAEYTFNGRDDDVHDEASNRGKPKKGRGGTVSKKAVEDAATYSSSAVTSKKRPTKRTSTTTTSSSSSSSSLSKKKKKAEDEDDDDDDSDSSDDEESEVDEEEKESDFEEDDDDRKRSAKKAKVSRATTTTTTTKRQPKISTITNKQYNNKNKKNKNKNKKSGSTAKRSKTK